MLIDPSGNPSIAFTLYAMECEGEIDSVAGKRNKVIKNLKQRPYWEVDEFAVRQEFLEVGLYNPTDEEVGEILREVRGY
jgi:hypothetical protein